MQTFRLFLYVAWILFQQAYHLVLKEIATRVYNDAAKTELF